jgi:hypothetical protein
MQFRLAHLLLVFPALPIGAVLGEFFRDRPRCTMFHYMVAANDMRQIQQGINMVRAFKNVEPTSDEVNAALANQPGQNARFRPYFAETQVDPWGQSYRCRANVAAQDGTTIPLGIYTCGRDGVSATDGFDRDDMRSWEDVTDSYYWREERTHERGVFYARGVLYWPLAYGLLLACSALIRRIFGSQEMTGAVPASNDTQSSITVAGSR